MWFHNYYFRNDVSTANSSNCEWHWDNDTKQNNEITDSKSLPRKSRDKEKTLINFDIDNHVSNWNTKLEDDAWEILKN